MIPRIIFIVPYRNRVEHKQFFTKYMEFIMEDYKKQDYEVFKGNFNIIENYYEILKLNEAKFIEKKNNITIIKTDMIFKDPQDWMREVIWYGHRSGKYLCKIKEYNIKTKKKETKSVENFSQPHFQ